MGTPHSPPDVALLGHRYQPFIKHTGTNLEIVGHRVQRDEHSIRTNTTVYYELGSVDPVGFASEAPEFRLTLEENVHDCSLDQVLAGKALVDTSWHLVNYINNALDQFNLLERDNSDNISGEIEFDNCVVAQIQWRWQMNQPIMGTYSIDGRLAKHWMPASAPHQTWGSMDTTTPGGIRIKDARLFLGGNSAGYRVYRLQGFTLQVTYRDTVVREAGNRSLVGNVVEPPETQLTIDLAAADVQPDDWLYTPQTPPSSYTYYDYVNPLLQVGNAIRVYDPSAAEGSSVIRAWSIENLIPADSRPILAQVRGLATKQYTLLVPKVTTAGTGGVVLYKGDIA